MANNTSSTGPFTWSGGTPPPNNINQYDYELSSKIDEIKNNSDFLDNYTESCFNQKNSLFSDFCTSQLTTNNISDNNPRKAALYSTARSTRQTSRFDTYKGYRFNHAHYSREHTFRDTQYHAYKYYDNGNGDENVRYGDYHSGRQDKHYWGQCTTFESGNHSSRHDTKHNSDRTGHYNSDNSALHSNKFAANYGSQHYDFNSDFDDQ